MATPRSGYWFKGKRVPGTTTIISRFKDSGGLIHWAWEQGRDGKDYRETRDKAAGCGTLAHAMVELFVAGDDPRAALEGATAELAELAGNAFDQWRRWFDQSRIEIIGQEMSLVHPLHEYGGTPDAIGKLTNGEIVLLDWKSANAFYRDNALQLAAYGALVTNGVLAPEGKAGEESLGIHEINEFHLCRFAKEYPDFEHRSMRDLDVAWQMFLNLRQAYGYDAQLKKRFG